VPVQFHDVCERDTGDVPFRTHGHIYNTQAGESQAEPTADGTASPEAKPTTGT
jgi:hypothetical protein